ncbi:MAG: ATP-binding cassette domain-containing protein [Chloroflexi bacterium]|jgi:multiple sugar transport system ATP-binding protein|nr:ATP-binding cassette domain-containing protein [Chloroflexota bacterium]
MDTVETINLKKHFGAVKAVDGVDLSIHEGEFFVILGPSGCGKTTLMRMIAGLETPTDGDIVIGGERVTELPPRKREVAMVFQSYALYPHMTVFDNIAFPLKAKKLPKEELRSKVDTAATVLGVDPLLDRKPRQLSGGERQRVALCRAMVKEPRVLLLDEPLSNLDAKLRTAARAELEMFQRQLGITTIFVTHDQIEAMAMGDRIVVMSAGKIMQVGPPQEIYHDPANLFVATFLGSPTINLVEKDGVLVGFRPEHYLPLESSVTENALTTVPLHVSHVENLGADRLVYGELENAYEGKLISAKLPSIVTAVVEPGEIYDFVIETRHLKFFDKATGLKTEAIPI